MRLSKAEQKQIIAAVTDFTGNGDCLYLFGSRTLDHKKGGDIDLLLSTVDNLASLKSNRYKIIDAIQRGIGDQRIDLVVGAENMLSSDPFLKSIFPTATLLQKFE
jgi:predicted nucleotidyltransferase